MVIPEMSFDGSEFSLIVLLLQISYGAMNPVFNNKFQFPSFYRTVPDERDQFTAIVLLLKHFGWNWVGIASSYDEDSQRINTELRTFLIQNRICVEFAVILDDRSGVIYREKGYGRFSRSTCSVVILYSNSFTNDLVPQITKNSALRRTFVLFGSFQIYNDYLPYNGLNGSLLVNLHRGNIPGLKDYLLDINPEKYPDNPMLLEAWGKQFYCVPESLVNISDYNPCRESYSFRSVDPSHYDVENFHYTFSVYSAVYLLAYALHDTHVHKKIFETRTQNWQPWQVQGICLSKIRILDYNTLAILNFRSKNQF